MGRWRIAKVNVFVLFARIEMEKHQEYYLITI
jgi:hypothetical protein